MSKRLTNEEIIIRFKSVHGNKFDYSKTEYITSGKKVEIICPIHGSFFQYPSDHSKGCGCSKCSAELNGASKRYSTEDFIIESKKVHGERFDYSKVNYIIAMEKVEIICPDHGSFFQVASEHISGRGCRKCKYENQSKSLMDTTESFVSKSKKVHGNLYDYSQVDYIDCWTKVKILCNKHGIFEQIPNLHINNSAGCYKCGKEICGDKLRKTTEQFILDSKKIHGDKYDYSISIYTNAHDKIDIICPTHGIFSVKASEHTNNNRGCTACAFTQSKPEKFIESILTKYNIPYTSNDRTIITPLELDFYIPSHKLAIEFDGTFYHSELTGNKSKNYHLDKTERCEKLGLQLIHIFEDEYNFNSALLESKIKNLLRLTKYKIFARKCEIREIGSKTKKQFIQKYHIQGDSLSKINLGLFHKNKLVQVMTFSNRRKALGATAKDGEFELSRMCSIKNFNIIGGASKLLKYFEKRYNPKKLISYADRRWSVGKVYYKLGFDKSHNSTPNYWYFSIKKNCKKWHRYMFAKHTLEKKLKIFDSALTEWDNMQNNGYDRIWDCGSLVYEKNY